MSVERGFGLPRFVGDPLDFVLVLVFFLAIIYHRLVALIVVKPSRLPRSSNLPPPPFYRVAAWETILTTGL